MPGLNCARFQACLGGCAGGVRTPLSAASVTAHQRERAGPVFRALANGYRSPLGVLWQCLPLAGMIVNPVPQCGALTRSPPGRTRRPDDPALSLSSVLLYLQLSRCLWFCQQIAGEFPRSLTGQLDQQVRGAQRQPVRPLDVCADEAGGVPADLARATALVRADSAVVLAVRVPVVRPDQPGARPVDLAVPPA